MTITLTRGKQMTLEVALGLMVMELDDDLLGRDGTADTLKINYKACIASIFKQLRKDRT